MADQTATVQKQTLPTRRPASGFLLKPNAVHQAHPVRGIVVDPLIPVWTAVGAADQSDLFREQFGIIVGRDIRRSYLSMILRKLFVK